MNKFTITLFLIITIFLLYNCTTLTKDSNQTSTTIIGETTTTTLSPEILKNVILSLTCIPENSTVKFVFNYAQYLNDGRGITFGIIGFTSGTYDGAQLLKRIQSKNSGHYLCSYIPAFEKINSLPHPDGQTDNTDDLGNFIPDFNKYGNDEIVRQSQLELLDELYWNPAMKTADDTGLKINISKGQIYDSYVRHGSSGTKKIITSTNNSVGSVLSGTDEKLWLQTFFTKRIEYVKAKEGRTKPFYRVERLYQGILDSGNVMLKPPFNVKCNDDETIFTITGERP